MGQIIKIRCNGPNKHFNDVDEDHALRTVSITKSGVGSQPNHQPQYPERIVLACRFCSDGKVIITRDMLEAQDKRRQRGVV